MSAVEDCAGLLEGAIDAIGKFIDEHRVCREKLLSELARVDEEIDGARRDMARLQSARAALDGDPEKPNARNETWAFGEQDRPTRTMKGVH
jgi:hypothetical protein